MPGHVQEFFVVTRTSIYQVRAIDHNRGGGPSAMKVAIRGESAVQVGEYLEDGTHVAVCDQLTVYRPHGTGGGTERRIENVNTRYWGGHSSPIVALFATFTEAKTCLESPDLVPSDPRWAKETRVVADAIGDDHPKFYICRHSSCRMALFDGESIE